MNAEINRILAMVDQVEASVVAAVKSEEALQAELAAKSAESARLEAAKVRGRQGGVG